MVCEHFISKGVCVFLVVGHGQNFKRHLSWMFTDLWEDQIAFTKYYWVFFLHENITDDLSVKVILCILIFVCFLLPSFYIWFIRHGFSFRELYVQLGLTK